MGETEGVIKFTIDHQPSALTVATPHTLNSWRAIFKKLGLIGQVKDRYQGLGFGNLSMRIEHGFLISGTQTGHIESH